MSKCPEARPLVVLPKGILSTWKREFSRWQVEEEDGDRTFPLLDFYSARADNRCQQLDVLQSWSRERSVLFLGYKQFSSIVCSDDDETAQTAECRRILLACPSILVLDEGHTPRNEDTDTLTSLGMVRTPRKVVLSGTLYQNSVREVFNIVNLVRPKFMNLPASRDLKRRILSRAKVSGTHTSSFSDREFFDIVEKTLSKDDNFPRKVAVIKDLREMTSNVLHYYKGDFLDELPGLMDFTVLLRLSEKQRNEVEKLKKLHNQRFRVISECSAIYIHPKLRSTEKIFGVLGDLDVKEGAKTKFYLNLLNLCESCGEKLLVFSQYLLPLKFLERLTRRIKGYSLGKEMFVITGDSESAARDSSVDVFNLSPHARVFFGSIRACGEGISLVGASRVVVLDVHLNPSVTRQAVGRAFRPGQTRRVYVYRLVAAGSLEEDDHRICFEKESVSRLWFEWSEHNGRRDSGGMTAVDVEACGDMFLESPCFGEDIVSLYRR
ncbi:hypothetical protein DM860_008033 [Cuscuta australis]|uniref:Helicase C-terminal domain-containing protein n=1 Tax=Cuscuta australis TaxID=267555 RepID=A0A328E157_9ASTE|nr:hypothetical protein DM860_008033 [Cuscuta australis]